MQTVSKQLTSAELAAEIAQLKARLAELSTRLSPADSDSARDDDAKSIEFLTENGFVIIRPWEARGGAPPDTSAVRFLVRDPHDYQREVSVEITEHVISKISLQTCGRIQKSHAFWICCAERHLADYVWEHNAFPVAGKLVVATLDPDDVMLAVHWCHEAERERPRATSTAFGKAEEEQFGVHA